MKKDKICKDEGCRCKEVFTGFEKQVKAKIGDFKKYAEKNPQKTKNILTSLGAGLAVLVAFFVGKNRKKDKNKNID